MLLEKAHWLRQWLTWQSLLIVWEKFEDKNTISDYDKEEMKRGFSIKTSLIPIPWQDCKINILDTPGYFDFVGEVEEAVSVCRCSDYRYLR